MSELLCSILRRFTLVYGYIPRVATSLCRLLFEKAKVNDALLFMTILSTDLKALKRRGYNGQYCVNTCSRFSRLTHTSHSRQNPQATTRQEVGGRSEEKPLHWIRCIHLFDDPYPPAGGTTTSESKSS